MTAAERPSLQHRARVTLAAVVVFLLLFAVVDAVALIVDRSDRNQLLSRLDPALQRSDALSTDTLDEETGIRGFVLAGMAPNAQIFLAPYHAGVAAEATDRSQLGLLLRAFPQMNGALAKLDGDLALWQEGTVLPALEGAEKGQAVLGDATLTAGKTQFDAIRADLATLDRAITRIRDDAIHRLTDAFWVIVATNVAVFIGLGLLVVGVAHTLRRLVIDPLIEVGADSRRVTEGDLDHVVAEAGPAEIAALAGDIEGMRSRIVDDLRAISISQELLEARTNELARSNRDLEQFAYVASHDLQEPLRKVASFCQLLSQRYGDQLDDRAAQYIAFAVDGAKRMQSLVNDLLSFSRVGRTTESFRDVDLAECVSSAQANLEGSLDESGGVIRVDGELPVVHGDPTLLIALFQNLIGNSLKFHSDATPLVTIGAERREESWELTIHDNGIGIEPQYAERVFVIFQRLHTRDRYDGTGIGLALCRKIVEFHGGEIWIDTEPGEGITFHVTLPASTAGDTAESEETQRA